MFNVNSNYDVYYLASYVEYITPDNLKANRYLNRKNYCLVYHTGHIDGTASVINHYANIFNELRKFAGLEHLIQRIIQGVKLWQTE